MADNETRRGGLLFAIGAYLSWGVLPLYFKAVAAVAPGGILAHRVLWSLLFLAAVVLLWRRWRRGPNDECRYDATSMTIAAAKANASRSGA